MNTGLVAPIVLTGTVYVCAGDKMHPVEIRFAPGHPITERDILLQIGKALAKVRREVDPDAELLAADDFFNGVLIADQYGQVGNFDLPESFDYDVEQVESEAMIALASSSFPTSKAIQ